MTEQWSLPGYAVLLVVVLVVVLTGVAVVAVLVALAQLARARAERVRSEQRLARAEEEAAALRETVAGIERRLGATPDHDAPGPALPDYVITRVGDAGGAGDSGEPVPARVVPAPLFADLVLRESVVQAASLAAGVRRALAPQTRARIRVEMRQEVRRARKQRRTDLRAARRDWEARGRREGSAA